MEFFAISNGIPVHILDTKKGDKILYLLHGYLETLYIFSEFIELIQDDYRVIAIDLPGHGLSGSSKTVNSMDFCADVVADVLKSCNVEEGTPITIAGHSMGGYVAQASIKKFPNLFSKLILLNSTPFADSPEKAIDREREITLIQNMKLNQIVSLSIPNTYAKENLRKFDDKILETEEIAETHDPQGIIASIKGMQQRPDYVDFLKTLSNFLIILGEKDKYITAEKREQLISLYPDNTKVLANVGHNCFIEAPVETIDLIKNL